MIELVRMALRVTDDDFDDEIEMLIDDCLNELADIGIISRDGIDLITDNQIKSCVVAYCKWKFGDNPDAEKWEAIYKDKIGRLKMTTGYGVEA